MRTLTAQETAILALGDRATNFRVQVDSDGAGTMVDLTNFLGHDWVVGAEYDEQIDAPVMAAKVLIRREIDKISLVPLMTASLANVYTGGYVPVLDGNRRILIDVALSPFGCNTPTTWQNVFDGKIVKPSWDSDPISLACFDKGHLLVRTWIETERQYGSAAGVAVETVMQQIITDNINTPGLGSVSLFSVNGSVATPWNPADSPAFNITPYSQQGQSVWDALLALAQVIGWDLRYRWHSASPAGFRLVLCDPTRSKTAADYVFGPDNYFDVKRAEYNPEDIRNAVRVDYQDSTTGLKATVTRTDSGSITRWGRLFCGISKSSTSLIHSSAAATALADAIVSDLASPTLEHEIELPYFYAGQLNDLYTFTANRRHYDSDQKLAASSMRHSLARESSHTTIGVRGKPSGGYRRWLGIAGGCKDVGISDGSVSPIGPDINTFRGENLVPNGDFGSVVSPGAAVPPIGWTVQIPGSMTIPQSGVWGVDILEDVTFQAAGNRSIKFMKSPTPGGSPVAWAKYLAWGQPIPIAQDDILSIELAAATTAALSAMPPIQALYLGVWGLDVNKQMLAGGLPVIATSQSIQVTNTFVVSRNFGRMSTAGTRYAQVIIGALFGNSAVAYNGWIDNVVVRRVSQAAHGVFKSGDSPQSIAANSITKLSWATERIDVGDVLATGTYTAYQAGMHNFRGSVSLDSLAATKTLTAYLYVNGSSNWSKAITTVSGTNTVQFTCSVLLNAGDTVDVRVQHNDTVSRNTTLDDQLSFFIGQRVS